MFVVDFCMDFGGDMQTGASTCAQKAAERSRADHGLYRLMQLERFSCLCGALYYRRTFTDLLSAGEGEEFRAALETGRLKPNCRTARLVQHLPCQA